MLPLIPIDCSEYKEVVFFALFCKTHAKSAGEYDISMKGLIYHLLQDMMEDKEITRERFLDDLVLLFRKIIQGKVGI